MCGQEIIRLGVWYVVFAVICLQGWGKVRWYGCTVVWLGVQLGVQLRVRCSGTVVRLGARQGGGGRGNVGTWGNGDVSAGVSWCVCGLVLCGCDVVRIRAGLVGIKVNGGWGTVGT